MRNTATVRGEKVYLKQYMNFKVNFFFINYYVVLVLVKKLMQITICTVNLDKLKQHTLNAGMVLQQCR